MPKDAQINKQNKYANTGHKVPPSDAQQLSTKIASEPGDSI
jgi:hypothetical protein